jgi:hypothetical protein
MGRGIDKVSEELDSSYDKWLDAGEARALAERSGDKLDIERARKLEKQLSPRDINFEFGATNNLQGFGDHQRVNVMCDPGRIDSGGGNNHDEPEHCRS